MDVTEEMNRKLLELIEKKCTDASKKRSEIRRLKEQMINKANIKIELEPNIEIEDNDEIEDEDDYNDEIEFYLESYQKLPDEYTYKDLKSILPSPDNYDYKNIILRLIAESYKEIKEINEVISEDKTMSKEELKEYKGLIDKERTKIHFLKDELNNENIEENTPIEIKNQLVLVPTIGGNIRVIDELERIPVSHYNDFLGIINSIINGTFRNVKTFKGNKELIGVAQVKDNNARVIFSRIDTNTYAVITAFIKNTGVNKYYHDNLKRKVAHYKENEETLKEKIKDEKFMEENELNVQRLFNLINPEEDKKVFINE